MNLEELRLILHTNVRIDIIDEYTDDKNNNWCKEIYEPQSEWDPNRTEYGKDLFAVRFCNGRPVEFWDQVRGCSIEGRYEIIPVFLKTTRVTLKEYVPKDPAQE